MVDALTMLPAVTEYAAGLETFRRVIELPLLSDARAAFSALTGLRKKYETVVMPFPATRWQYAAVASVLRPRRLIMHNYGGISHVLARMSPATLVQLQGGHRIAENARLAEAISRGFNAGLEYIVPKAWRAPRITGLLGVHPGTMRYKGNEFRRWPLEHFIALVKLNSAQGRKIRVFIGPQERDLVSKIKAESASDVEFIEAGLGDAARALSECEVFFGNDAGMAHVAAGLGVKTVTVFGMTDPLRAAPCGKTLVVRSRECAPCHDEGTPDFRCALNIDYRCLSMLSSQDAQQAIDRAFREDVETLKVARSGEYKLYGKRHEVQSA